MDRTNLLKLLQLRLLVGAAGELTAPPWWRTQFLTETGQRMLLRVFPRTALRAGIESVTLAAARDHDERVGARAFHLFRLPSDVEQRLADLLSEPESVAALALPSGGLSDVLTALDAFAGDAVARSVSSYSPEPLDAAAVDGGAGATVEGGEGPRKIGAASRVTRTGTQAQVAVAYGQAVRQGVRVYPYFEAEDSP